MVKLFCVFVGVAGSEFSVRVEEDDTIDDLKIAIKAENEDITCDAHELQLYLAKKGDEWLSSDGAHAVTLDGHGNPRGFDKMDPTLRIKNDRYFGENFQLNGQIHVLVMVPPEDVVAPPSVPVAVPTGPEANLRSCDHLLAFLESEMTNMAATASRPHILAQQSLEFRLVGREQAIVTASRCFENIIAHARSTASDRNRVVMPVCSGMSGLGKTRMLEEAGAILERMNLEPNHVVRVIIPYYNECRPQPVEQSIPKVAREGSMVGLDGEADSGPFQHEYTSSSSSISSTSISIATAGERRTVSGCMSACERECLARPSA